jgi:hypothetical protein
MRWPWPIRSTVSEFAWSYRETSLDLSVRIGGISAEIRTEHFPNTDLNLYIYTTLISINDDK